MEFALAGFAGEGEFLLEGVRFGLPLGLRFGTLMGRFGAELGGFRAAGALGAVEFGEVFAAGAGLVDGAEFGEELRVEGGVFVAQDGVALDGEAVLAGVLGGGGFAFGSAGSGGVLGVGAILRNEAGAGGGLRAGGLGLGRLRGLRFGLPFGLGGARVRLG